MPETVLTAPRLRPFGVSIFSEMTALAVKHQAINLAQGFPDFEGPPAIRAAAAAAMAAGHNQYARSMGHPLLVQAIADIYSRHYGLTFDPFTDIAVTCGATEGIAAALFGLLSPGDEVILFEPFYDSYPALVALAGATPRFYTLRFPDFALDTAALSRLFTPRTRLVILNTPHNPTGKVFTREELADIAALCERHDVLVVADEVYEHLTFAGARHVPIAGLPGMRERTLTLSSAGKTFSYTGWKVGWAAGPAPLIAAMQAAHQFLTFCAATPLQVAMAAALNDAGPAFFGEFTSAYAARRAQLLDMLAAAGFDAAPPAGTYFALAAFGRLWSGDDRSLAYRLIEKVGVATIPTSAFYHEHPEEGRRLLRFAFCKRTETLQAAAERLASLAGAL